MKRLLFVLCILSAVTAVCGTQSSENKRRPNVHTSDELYWEGERYVISDSPLACFEGYRSIFPQMPPLKTHILGNPILESPPTVQDKNYEAIWKIVDNRLYLSDIKFNSINRYDYSKYLKPDENVRFTIVERLTKKQFNRHEDASAQKPVSPYGTMAATRFSDTLVIKSYPDWVLTDYDTWVKTSDTQLIFKDGKIISIKKI